MELRDYIEMGITKCGNAVELGRELDQVATVIRNAKGHQRGLPIFACVKLAKLIDVEPMEVIAASELVTEKKEERIAIFRPFVQMAGHARHLTIAGIAATTALMLAAENSLLIARDLLL